MEWGKTASVVLLVVCGVLIASAAASADTSSKAAEAAPCEDPEHVERLGTVCDTGPLYEVVLDEDTVVTTHGHDPVPGEGDASDEDRATWPGNLDADREPPTCVEESEYHHRLIYAHPQDVDSRYEEVEDDLRAMVQEVNGFLAEEGRQEGVETQLPFLCNEDGEVRIDEVELAHDNADTSFGQVVCELRGVGWWCDPVANYDSEKAKHWVWVDDLNDEVDWGGTGNLAHDDTDAVDNANNRGPDFAVTWGNFYSSTMLHEAAHNMGAVQSSAPHFYDNVGGWHCYELRDIMCYGEDTRFYEEDGTVYCPTFTAFDCGKDDYFDPTPEPGTYLDEHWNIGSELNRFIERTPCTDHAKVTRHAYSCGPAADATLEEDARGHRVAASGTGDASGTVAVSGTGSSSGTLAASGTDAASGSLVAASGQGTANGPIAVSGTGDASSASGNVCVQICLAGGGWLAAASGTGDADGFVAVAGLGTADGGAAVSGSNDCAGQSCYDVAVRDDAEGRTLAVSGTGSSEATFAVSATGPATGYGAVSGTDTAAGTQVVSGTGDANSCRTALNCIAVSGTGDASGVFAVSLTGSSDGTSLGVSGCDTASEEAGTTVLCVDP